MSIPAWSQSIDGLWTLESGFSRLLGQLEALKTVSQVLDGRFRDHRRRSPRYSYNADSAGLVDGSDYPACDSGVGFVAKFCEKVSRGPLSVILLSVSIEGQKN